MYWINDRYYCSGMGVFVTRRSEEARSSCKQVNLWAKGARLKPFGNAKQSRWLQAAGNGAHKVVEATEQEAMHHLISNICSIPTESRVFRDVDYANNGLWRNSSHTKPRPRYTTPAPTTKPASKLRWAYSSTKALCRPEATQNRSYILPKTIQCSMEHSKASKASRDERLDAQDLLL